MAGLETSDPNKRTSAGATIITDNKLSNTIGSSGGPGSGSRTSEAISMGINALGEGAMQYAAGSGKGKNNYQKTLNRANLGFDAATAAIGTLGPWGMAISAVLQGANWAGGKLAKKANTISLGSTIGESGAYKGTAYNIEEQGENARAYNKSGGFGKLFGNREKLNLRTSELKNQQQLGSNILKTSKKKLSGIGYGSQLINAQNTTELNNLTGNEIRSGKVGMKLERSGLTKEILSQIITKNVTKLKDGGKLNIIVDGKLHSQSHDLKDHLDIDVTGKGVPVVEMEEGGKLTEQASEVERDELILHLELVKKLEELKEKGDEASMIEAGKILSEEIVKNTRDSKSKILKNA